MKEPSVTVLVTVKNSETTIKKCINSLLNLNYKNYKIYITDAYSTDKTWKILQKLGKKYPEKLKIERLKGNIARAYNYMIKNVNTDFIAFTDADCTVDKNWLKNLILGFNSNQIVATAGFCKTPKKVNELQKLIGKELEERFKNFPEFIPRAPTMNLCVKTRYAKKVKFDERFDVAQETDFGYRLTKFGKMKYVPKAIVYHYHRPTWLSFFKQQLKYGTFVPLLYWKHKGKAKGDHISKPVMIWGELIFCLACLFLLLTIFWLNFYYVTLIFLLFLFVLYTIEVKNLRDPKYYLLFFVRNLAWTFGLLYFIFKIPKIISEIKWKRK